MTIPEKHDLKKALQKYWGYDDFRYPQEDIISAMIKGNDCLVVMATGGGKSLCFQLPALLQQGLTIVISPLVALMENQVRELQSKNLPVGILHSEIDKGDRQKTLQLLKQQKLKLIYLSPETIFSPPIWDIISLPDVIIQGLIIDEAHCLVQWGDSFRPDYSRLGTIRPNLVNDKSKNPFYIACFTATADDYTQKNIIKLLNLSSPQQFISTPYRDNINIKISQVWTVKGRQKQLINHLNSNKNKSGLIYVRTRKDSEKLADFLKELGYKNQSYHGGLDGRKRRQIESDWLEEKIKFVVCTSAFGMGINKGNLRWIFHYQAPLLLSEYIQEIGRGGRDGKATTAITLISETTGWLNPEDKTRRNFFLQQQIKQYQQAEKLLNKIPLQGDILRLKREDKLLLAILYRSGQLQWLDPFSYKITPKNTHKSIENLIIQQKQLTQQTTEYLTSKKCRWQFLLSAFGFFLTSDFRCGKCDNCLKLFR